MKPDLWTHLQSEAAQILTQMCCCVFTDLFCTRGTSMEDVDEQNAMGKQLLYPARHPPLSTEVLNSLLHVFSTASSYSV